MDEALLAAFRGTHFLVCIDAIEWADIRVDQTLPVPLRTLVAQHPWGFLTAWNPQASQRPEAENLIAQRELAAALQQLPDILVRPAIGVGVDWHEPNLFVVGADIADLDALAHRHGQLAYVHGHADGAAILRLLA